MNLFLVLFDLESLRNEDILVRDIRSICPSLPSLQIEGTRASQVGRRWLRARGEEEEVVACAQEQGQGFGGRAQGQSDAPGAIEAVLQASRTPGSRRGSRQAAPGSGAARRESSVPGSGGLCRWGDLHRRSRCMQARARRCGRELLRRLLRWRRWELPRRGRSRGTRRGHDS
jgi:hypothetical protein